jgi:hypothetical protein
VKVATGNGVMVIIEVFTTAGQPPTAASVFVTVYVPGVLPARFTRPEPELILSPACELNTPPTAPLAKVGDGLLEFWQYGEPV